MKSFYNYGVWFCIFAIIGLIFRIKNDQRILDAFIKDYGANSEINSYKGLFAAVVVCVLPVINWVAGIAIAVAVISNKVWDKFVDWLVKDDR